MRLCASPYLENVAMCAQVPTYLEDGSPSPLAPVAGQDFMLLDVGDVVDVVLQNLPGNANGALPSLRPRLSPSLS